MKRDGTAVRPQTQIPPPLTPEEVWKFSVAYYSIKEVKHACLDLQEHYRGSVGLVLLFKFLDETGITINTCDWERLIHAASISDALIRDFRCLRNQLRHKVPRKIYQQSIGFELQLERHQQLDLLKRINPVKTLSRRNTNKIRLTSKYCIQLTAGHLVPLFSKPVSNDWLSG